VQALRVWDVDSGELLLVVTQVGLTAALIKAAFKLLAVDKSPEPQTCSSYSNLLEFPLFFSWNIGTLIFKAELPKSLGS